MGQPRALRSIYVCQSCGHGSPRFLGCCPECSAWGSLVEEPAPPPGSGHRGGWGRPAASDGSGGAGEPIRLSEVTEDPAPRLRCGLAEFDRVLGGGLVPGSLVLLGGEPGIGKSTLLLQILAGLGRSVGPVLYVSGEESLPQTALRAGRIGARSPDVLVYAETRLEQMLAEARRRQARVLAVDSVQTVYAPELSAVPGSMSQVRTAASALLAFAKRHGVATLLIGHVTKDGGLAGPKQLEHLVDAVLYFEGEPQKGHRLLRAAKNRFGSTAEVGVFEMRGAGLVEVSDPSELFLAERAVGAAGALVVASAEGTRPMLVELQALVARSGGGIPRRTCVGVDTARVSLLLAVLERHSGIDVLSSDVFVNVAGGVRLTEPAVDLGIVCALASGVRGRAIEPTTLVFGEVGLAGEVRAVGAPEIRIREARRLGFRRCVLPEANRARVLPTAAAEVGFELCFVRDLQAALRSVGLAG